MSLKTYTEALRVWGNLEQNDIICRRFVGKERKRERERERERFVKAQGADLCLLPCLFLLLQPLTTKAKGKNKNGLLSQLLIS